MKKKWLIDSLDPGIVKKTIRIMKLTTVFILGFLIIANANTYSQTTKLNISINNQAIRNVIEFVEENSEYVFLYKNEDFNVDKKVDINLKNATINEILDVALNDEDVVYDVYDRQIVIRKPTDPIVFFQQEERTVTGVVTDKKGLPLPGVSVVIMATTTGVVTNSDGEFTLTVPADAHALQFSYVGMKTQEIPLDGRTTYTVVMEEDAIGIEEVVAIGYGSIKRSDLTGSVASVSVEDFKNSSSISVTEALQGRAAGVQISTGDASPGGGINIRIRGTSTINGATEPLYIVDGFPINSNSDDLYVVGGIAEGEVEGAIANKVPPNPLSAINPNDIESIEILKDASATAIYGSRGANGVILIKTKRGISGETKIDFNYSYSLQQLAKKIPRLTGPEYAEWINEGYRNSGYSYDYYDGSDYWRPLPQNAITTDWQDLIYQTAPTENYSLSFTGGNEKTKYLISGDYLNQEGIIIKSGYERATARINIDQQVRSFLKVGVNMNVTHSINNRVAAGSGVLNTNVVRELLTRPPLEDPEWFDEIRGKWFLNPDDPNNNTNPLKVIEDTDDKTITNRIIGNAFADVDISEGLKFHGSAGVDYSNGERQTYLNSTLRVSNRDVNGGYATDATTMVNRWMANGYFNWEKVFDKHNLSATAGVEVQTQVRDTRFMGAEKFDSDDLGFYAIGTGTVGLSIDATRVKWQTVGYFARANYNFNNKYYVTANFRADGSSRFGESNKWGFFPSIAGSWRMSEEDFIKELNLFSNLKLRASYGETGNGEIPPYSSLGNWSITNMAYSYDGQLVNGAYLTKLENPDLKWETTKQYNIGVDAGFFNNRLGVTFDYYLKNTVDLILAVNIPKTTGFQSALKNVGAIKNEGAEITITGVPVEGEFSWNVNYNMTFMRSMATDLGEDVYLNVASWSRMNGVRLQVNKPASLIMGTLYDGVFNSQEEINNWGTLPSSYIPGFYKPVDVNGDGTTTGDAVPLGNGQPDFIFGLTNNFSYKNFDLNIFMQGSYGNEIAMMYDRDMYEIRDNSWTASNHDAKYGLVTVDGNGRSGVSNINVHDGSYIRLKDIRLGYNIPVRDIKWLSAAKVYFNGSNLITITNYPGYNPDVSSSGNWAFGEGFDMGVYPLAKIYKIGVNLTF